VVLATLVAADRSHLVCLDDEILLEAGDRLARRLGCHLVGVADRDECCHDVSLLAPAVREIPARPTMPAAAAGSIIPFG
jgi:hypothetical protein